MRRLGVSGAVRPIYGSLGFKRSIYRVSHCITIHNRDHAVAHVLEALRYKPKGRGFDSLRGHWNFSLT